MNKANLATYCRILKNLAGITIFLWKYRENGSGARQGKPWNFSQISFSCGVIHKYIFVPCPVKYSGLTKNTRSFLADAKLYIWLSKAKLETFLEWTLLCLNSYAMVLVPSSWANRIFCMVEYSILTKKIKELGGKYKRRFLDERTKAWNFLRANPFQWKYLSNGFGVMFFLKLNLLYGWIFNFD